MEHVARPKNLVDGRPALSVTTFRAMDPARQAAPLPDQILRSALLPPRASEGSRGRLPQNDSDPSVRCSTNPENTCPFSGSAPRRAASAGRVAGGEGAASGAVRWLPQRLDLSVPSTSPRGFWGRWASGARRAGACPSRGSRPECDRSSGRTAGRALTAPRGPSPPARPFAVPDSIPEQLSCRRIRSVHPTEPAHLKSVLGHRKYKV
jgi:hypothetical protein